MLGLLLWGLTMPPPIPPPPNPIPAYLTEVEATLLDGLEDADGENLSEILHSIYPGLTLPVYAQTPTYINLVEAALGTIAGVPAGDLSEKLFYLFPELGFPQKP